MAGHGDGVWKVVLDGLKCFDCDALIPETNGMHSRGTDIYLHIIPLNNPTVRSSGHQKGGLAMKTIATIFQQFHIAISEERVT